MTARRFVADLPDLIQPEDYAADPRGRRLRLRIRASADGVEVLGDAMQVQELERLLAELSPEEIEQMLCG
ncbi:radical SAM-modified peptide, FtsH ternary system-associated [Thiohalocapsa sp. ML1]|jgi:hypothetical protein|uniref:radical SAM-modified peptide, FtsH ternary system-associated n=1 Tax=Thiohalocapsa sp. ML1 TaxID=1431688 RepID=UPI00073238FC|nr:radical SAM-modified peptide, FtsH ternary system-associated [Thiohalocapsa sp. ML1]